MKYFGPGRLLPSVLMGTGILAALAGCGEGAGESRQQMETPGPGLRVAFKPEPGTALSPGDVLEITAEANPGLRYFEMMDNPVLDCRDGQALGHFRRTVLCEVLADPVHQIVVTVKVQNSREEKTETAVFPVVQAGVRVI